MYVRNITKTYDNISKYNITANRTVNENFIDILILTLLLTLPYGISFLCLMSLMVYTIKKTLFNIKG